MTPLKPSYLHVPGEARTRRLASHLDRQRAAMAAVKAALPKLPDPRAIPEVRLEPVDFSKHGNELRPATFDQMVGQDKLKPLLRRLVANVKTDPSRRLPHLLMVGASGTGKTTTSIVVARELGARCFALKAPLDMGTLDALRKQARDGDVVFVDEIHQQVHGDRRGITQACDPESFYQLLEDGVLALPHGPQPFPKVTWIGATTDVGLLPEPLSNRFPLQPRLEEYTEQDMIRLAVANAGALHLMLDKDVAFILAKACRRNPRQLNSYMHAAQALAAGQLISKDLATEVVISLAGSTLDGLTPSMQTCLRFLYKSCKKDYVNGRVLYSCSVNQLATACGHGRDTRAISLLTEPWLIQSGLLSVQHTGRCLTEAGIARAQELVNG